MMTKIDVIIPEVMDESLGRYLGSKTLNLKKCLDWGFNVPRFVALPSSISRNLLADEAFRRGVISAVTVAVCADRYVVRSSALSEDGSEQSFAGQFLTRVNLSKEELDGGICEVLQQAEKYLKGDVEKFSLIIQEYIVADISGVAFTRNPNGNREMILEYGFCEGEKIVSGEIKPIRTSFYWNNLPVADLPEQFSTEKIVEKFKDLEVRNMFPQDIEWCIKNDKFYLLQTRPITTISQLQHEQACFLDDLLSKDEKYLFEKTEISEIAPRPSGITYGLLERIYSKDGPVDRIYGKYGINYEDTKFLKLIGNELFIDREKEIKGLLQAYSYLRSGDFDPKLADFQKLLPTVRNLFYLKRIKSGNHEDIFNNLKRKIESINQNSADFKTVLDGFLCDYELIFEINLLSGLSVKKLSLLLRKEGVSLPEIMSGHAQFIDLKKYQISCVQGLRGNSLELADNSDFVASDEITDQKNSSVMVWWEKLPEYKRKFFHDPIVEAIIYNRLREFGRWLTVKNVGALRDSLLGIAKKNGFLDCNNIYFSKLEDVLDEKVVEVFCKKNKIFHDSFNRFCFPSRITSVPVDRKSKILGVSSGLASGYLQKQEILGDELIHGGNKKIILYTEVLSPDLTKYFSKISGIVSNNGGLLSHLAIVAREKNVPVIVGYSLDSSEFKLGDYVQIDGSNGKISKIEAV